MSEDIEDQTKDEKLPLKTLGRTIGTFTGWDEGGDAAFIFYGFVSSAKNIQSGDLQVDYENGKFALYDDEGNTTWEIDIIEALMELPRE